MTSLGAVSGVRNPQAPRFVIIEVREDGTYNLKEIEI